MQPESKGKEIAEEEDGNGIYKPNIGYTPASGSGSRMQYFTNLTG